MPAEHALGQFQGGSNSSKAIFRAKRAYHELFHGVVSMRLALPSLEFKFVISRLNNLLGQKSSSAAAVNFSVIAVAARVNVSSVINRASKTAEQIGIR